MGHEWVMLDRGPVPWPIYAMSDLLLVGLLYHRDFQGTKVVN